jgi:Zn-dependent protease
MVDRRVASTSRAAFRPSAVFLGIVALWATAGVMAWQDFGNRIVNVLLFVIAGWVVSLSLHEYSHAVVAYHAGDRSTAERGYLTLNPLKYTHPVLSIVLPVFFLLIGGIGLPGGAVWINHGAIQGRLRNSLISVVGPGANIVFLFALMVPFAVGLATPEHETFWAALAFLALLQLMAAGLNLIPIPGVDGGNAVRPWLTGSTARFFDVVAPYGMLLLFALIFSPMGNRIFFTIIFDIGDVIGLPLGLAEFGRSLMLFWR